ncbi:hypothetical protein [Clostridium sp.]
MTQNFLDKFAKRFIKNDIRQLGFYEVFRQRLYGEDVVAAVKAVKN